MRAVFTAAVDDRPYRATRRPPAEMLEEERAGMDALPSGPCAAFGATRRVTRSATISYGAVAYSVPHILADQVVWVRDDGD